MTRQLLAVCALGLLLRLGASPASAEEGFQPSGPPIAITADPGGALYPAVASDATGNFAVVWLGHFKISTLGGEVANILLQRYDAGGQPLGPEIEVTPPIFPVGRPRIAVGLDGGMVVTWSDQSKAVRARRLAADGRPVGEVITVSAESDCCNTLPDIAFLHTGDFVVVWYKDQSLAPILLDSPLLARLFDAAGTPRGATFQVTTAFGGRGRSRVAADPTGGFAVVWEEFIDHVSGGPPPPPFRVRRFAEDGSPRGPEHSVTNDTGYGPVPLFTRTGELSVAWADAGYGAIFNPPALYAQRLAGDDSPVGPKLLLAAGAALDGPLDAADDRQGHRLLVWAAPGATVGSQAEIRVRLFDTAWQPAEAPIRVAQFTPRSLSPWPVIASGTAGFLTVWDGLRTPADPLPQITGQLLAGPCPAGGLCLQNGRFRAEVAWRDPRSGAHGTGNAVPLTGDTGAFWFFSPGNAELLVKVLDGRQNNGHWWLFFGALTDVEYDLTVTDTEGGEQKVYHNPPFTMASHADVDAFTDTLSPTSPRPALRTAGAVQAALGDFAVAVEWIDPATGQPRQAAGTPLSNDSAYFWFFDAANIELVVKVLDGRLVNGHRWVFYGALTDVEYTLTVTERASGKKKSYHNPRGRMASQADTSAF